MEAGGAAKQEGAGASASHTDARPSAPQGDVCTPCWPANAPVLRRATDMSCGVWRGPRARATAWCGAQSAECGAGAGGRAQAWGQVKDKAVGGSQRDASTLPPVLR